MEAPPGFEPGMEVLQFSHPLIGHTFTVNNLAFP